MTESDNLHPYWLPAASCAPDSIEADRMAAVAVALLTDPGQQGKKETNLTYATFNWGIERPDAIKPLPLAETLFDRRPSAGGPRSIFEYFSHWRLKRGGGVGSGEDAKTITRPLFREDFLLEPAVTAEVQTIWGFFHFIFTLSKERFAESVITGKDIRVFTPYNYAELIWLSGKDMPAFTFFFRAIRNLSTFRRMCEADSNDAEDVPFGGNTPLTLKDILSDPTLRFAFMQTKYFFASLQAHFMPKVREVITSSIFTLETGVFRLPTISGLTGTLPASIVTIIENMALPELDRSVSTSSQELTENSASQMAIISSSTVAFTSRAIINLFTVETIARMLYRRQSHTHLPHTIFAVAAALIESVLRRILSAAQQGLSGDDLLQSIEIADNLIWSEAEWTAINSYVSFIEHSVAMLEVSGGPSAESSPSSRLSPGGLRRAVSTTFKKSPRQIYELMKREQSSSIIALRSTLSTEMQLEGWERRIRGSG